MEEKKSLLRCPFCGGEAELYTGYQIARTGEYLANVRCRKCGITVPMKVSLDQAEAEAEAIEAWNRRVDDHFLDATKMVERTAVPNNKVHFCDFCKYCYPGCPAEMSDVIFGNGKGQDNICACAKFEIKPERTAKVEILPRRSETSMSWEGKCSNCGAYTIHEMNYCFECGARLEWE